MEQEKDNRPKELSRRDFLRGLTASAAGGAALYAGDAEAAPPGRGLSEGGAGGAYSILIDTTKCRYCQACAEACADKHQRSSEFYMDLTFVHFREEGRNHLAVPMRCLHCADPACVKVCQGKALHKTPEGAVVLDKDRCIGCLTCTGVCPFAKTLHYDQAQKKVYKCDMCYDRISQGATPACVEACQARGFDALRFGPTEEILAEARRRAAVEDGVVLYPGQTQTVLLFAKDEVSDPRVAANFGITETYPQAARVKAGVMQYGRLAWLPVLGGVGLWLANWRNAAGDEAPAEKEEQ